jgi:hypothetical protein
MSVTSSARWARSSGARRAPRLDTPERPALSLPRGIGLLTIRGYILFAIVIVVIKLVQRPLTRSDDRAAANQVHKCDKVHISPLSCNRDRVGGCLRQLRRAAGRE